MRQAVIQEVLIENLIKKFPAGKIEIVFSKENE